jgi:membrane protease YdiL (CAAX protease family)
VPDASEGWEREPDNPISFEFLVLFEGALAPMALVLGWVARQPALEGFEWSARSATLGALAAMPMFGMLLVGMSRPVGPLARIKRFFEEEARPVLVGRSRADLMLLSLVAGIGEEMLFRGVIQAALGRWLGRWVGLAGASLMFGLLHPISPTYVVIATALGAYLGGLYMIDGNLLSAIVAHALYDFLALIVLVGDDPTSGSDRELKG